MATVTEDYCSYEVAKLLKEKGFESDINAYYHIWDNGNKVCSVLKFSRSEAPHLYIPAPTLQMAMKWLREVHNLFVLVEFDPPIFSSDIYKMDEVDEYGGAKHISPTFVNCKNYEQACEAAIKYCLENLV